MRYWLESSMVNVTSETMAAHSANFGRLAQLFKGALKQGDLVAFYYQPGTGLTVSVNDVELDQLTGVSVGGFFRVLLRCWIGDVPLSSDIRRGLLAGGTVDPDLMSRFTSLQYSPERQAAVTQWQISSDSPNENPTSASFSDSGARVAIVSAKGEATAKDKALAEDKPPSKKQSISSKSAAKIRNKQSEKNNKIAAEVKPKKVIDLEASTVFSAEAAAPASGGLAISSQTVEPFVDKTSVPGRATDLKTTDVAMLAIPEQDASLSQLTSIASESALHNNDEALAGERDFNAVREAYSTGVANAALRYQTLPRQAFQKRLEGDVQVMVTLDRKGNILSAEIAEASPYLFFNQQALEAVKEAAPYPAIPDVLSGKQFVFSVPFSYRLPF